MALSKYKLGDLIQESFRKNDSGKYDISFVRGISNSKQITDTKADVDNSVIRKFYIVNPGEFVYNPRTTRMGERVGLGYNNSSTPLLFSFNNIAFYIKDSARSFVLPEYLYLYFNRSEFDRYAMTNSWGSATELFSMAEMCDIDIQLPDLPTQQKYVDIYNAMVANQQSYEHGLEDLKLVLDATIERYKHSHQRIALCEITNELDERNLNRAFTVVKGVNKEKRFMPAVASGDDLSKYKVVRKNQFACNLMHVGRDVAVPIALYTDEKPIIVSPAYVVFGINNEGILPQYVLIWLSRTETERHAWFMCDNNIRGGMEKRRFFEMDIPVPSIEEQRALVKLFGALSLRRANNERLKTQIKDLCPILIKGSLEEGKRDV